MLSGLRYNILRPSVCVPAGDGEGSLNTTSSGLATGMNDDGTMAYRLMQRAKAQDQILQVLEPIKALSLLLCAL